MSKGLLWASLGLAAVLALPSVTLAAGRDKPIHQAGASHHATIKGVTNRGGRVTVGVTNMVVRVEPYSSNGCNPTNPALSSVASQKGVLICVYYAVVGEKAGAVGTMHIVNKAGSTVTYNQSFHFSLGAKPNQGWVFHDPMSFGPTGLRTITASLSVNGSKPLSVSTRLDVK
ncbi:MAG TPA: hypothetical protein VFB58_15695 [Chloroflexota bacterium]|nr:hypothetical protein [Chloroflexota bacterium]